MKTSIPGTDHAAEFLTYIVTVDPQRAADAVCLMDLFRQSKCLVDTKDLADDLQRTAFSASLEFEQAFRDFRNAALATCEGRAGQ